ncbi:hypothetical protein NP233_g5460 [Leucocoprinus birnbaumii]|uniref:Protein YOP1 n=1 Tax=Leucocoprinus birnbaumii TaxID=56174 RepID=A0AAD5VSU5_9AGAR|nr:hypothetical protein NP233_g5460 [Leucocoprinus birnbaumii]
MAVFVRLFRLAMLFFNVYDSYKVLRIPPPSASNKGKPSLRAMSQRKRDMKGCLAVWIVWSCFIMYERFAEAVVSLFIPFYDEFKSLVLLFLIMTRARGAEPIYLHIIRPFLKPYTSTIDQLLDFTHVIGDVVFGLASLPFVYAIDWWRRKFRPEPESLDTETEASSSPLSTAAEPQPQVPVNHPIISKPVKATANLVPKPRQPAPKRSSASFGERKVKTTKIQVQARGEVLAIPPQEIPTNDKPQIDGLPVVDEWRQYPAFPSAYPPTPLVKQTQLAATTMASVSTSLYPTISEEPAQQGFQQSLLPPHNDLDPSCAGDKSDEIGVDGVQPEESGQITIAVTNVDGDDEVLDESMEDGFDELESEDEFNVTLRTPDTSLRILTSLGPPRPLSTEISPLSLPSVSALTTADEESSLNTPSTESTTSEYASMPPTVLASNKRALQPASTVTNMRVRNSLVARGTTKASRGNRPPAKRPATSQRRPTRPKQGASSRTLERLESPELENEPPIEGEELTIKRRRVSLTPPTAVQVPGPAKRRVVRPASSSMKTTRVASVQKSSSLHPSARA